MSIHRIKVLVPAATPEPRAAAWAASLAAGLCMAARRGARALGAAWQRKVVPSGRACRADPAG
jgi:hypothetical protein